MGSVELRGVRKAYGALEVIKDIDLSVPDRELVVFVGPSGCGKSTLLRMIAGLEDVDYGDILIGGRDVTELPPAKRGVAMVFQNYALYPHMTAFENMAYGLRRAGMPTADIDRRVRETAAMLQITELLSRRPKAMSGGQRQRVAIGRAIVREPSVFLFDEPLSNLDASLRVEMRSQLARLHRELDATMIFVTHDQVEAMTLADRIVVLNAGRIEQVGKPLDVFHAPANLFVAGFIGSPAMNLLPATTGHLGVLIPSCRPSVELNVDFRPLAEGTKVTLGLRPERLELCAPGAGGLDGEVVLAEHLGNETIVHLAVAAETVLVVKSASDLVVRIGDRRGIAFDPRQASLFDAEGNRVEGRVAPTVKSSAD